MHSPTNLPLTPAGVLLEADPCLEGDVADGEADPPASYQLSCSFLEDGRFHGPPACVKTGRTFSKVLATGVALCWQAGQCGKWGGYLVPQEALHDA